MKIRAFIEVKKTTREEFESKFPKHTIGQIDDRDFLTWCVMCPEPIFVGQTFVFVDDDNKWIETGSSLRKAHADHFFSEIARD